MTPAVPPAVARLFHGAPFVADLGLRLDAAGAGTATTSLDVTPRHAQQDGFVHFGVQATMADHTAGAAGASLLPDGKIVLSAIVNVNLLRPARGSRLVCRARVLKPGRSLSVVESEVYSIEDGVERLASKATVTLAVVDAPTAAGR